MKTKALLFALFFFTIGLNAQQMSISLSSADQTPLDSVTALNLRTGESITFPGNETLILSSGTGIDLIDNDLNAIIYPNPNTGQSSIVINVPEEQDIVISVRNQLGQLVCQSMEYVQPGPQAFSLSLKTAGIYFVSVLNSGGLGSFQVVTTRNNNYGNIITKADYRSPVTCHLSLIKSGYQANTLDYILGDIIRYTCYSSVHTTIFQEMPREFRDYKYTVSFHPCIDPDGMSYPAVEIGEQIWMAKNLAYLPALTPVGTGSGTEPNYYVYGYEGGHISSAKATNVYKEYGVLYNWEAAKISCPEGWYLPSDEEWMQMESHLGMNESHLYWSGINSFRLSGDVGKKLKSDYGWSSNGNGIDSEGFKGLPAGYHALSSQFNHLGDRGIWWSSSYSSESNGAFGRGLFYDSDGNIRRANLLTDGYSVRCIKDTAGSNQPPVASFTLSPESGPNTTRVVLDASGCTDDNTPSEELQVRWDFDSDQENGWDTEFVTEKRSIMGYSDISVYQHVYTVRLEVMDSEGATSIVSKELEIDNTGTITDPRDNTTYKTIIIGDQTWMAENLKWLPSVSPLSSESYTEPHNYVYGYNGSDVETAKSTENYEIYGVLYNVPSALISCPAGWHLPSDLEFQKLEEYMGLDSNELELGGYRNSGSVGEKLKSDSLWNDNGNGKNSVGFNLFPAGDMHDATFEFIGLSGVIWSSTIATTNNQMGRLLESTEDGIYKGSGPKIYGFSVRCLKNE